METELSVQGAEALGAGEEAPLEEKKGCRTSSRSTRVQLPPKDVLSGRVKRPEAEPDVMRSCLIDKGVYTTLPLKRS